MTTSDTLRYFSLLKTKYPPVSYQKLLLMKLRNSNEVLREVRVLELPAPSCLNPISLKSRRYLYGSSNLLPLSSAHYININESTLYPLSSSCSTWIKYHKFSSCTSCTWIKLHKFSISEKLIIPLQRSGNLRDSSSIFRQISKTPYHREM